MGPIIAIVAIIMTLSIPISAIITSAILKAKKMNLQSGGGISSQDKLLLKKALEENESLRNRIENLEMITSDPDNLKISNVSEDNLQNQINSLKKEIFKLTAHSEKDTTQ